MTTPTDDGEDLAPVATAVEEFVADLDATLPGASEGIYLVGSVALQDFHPDTSDIDLVVVLGSPPDPVSTGLVADVHTRFAAAHRGLRLDTTYTTWADLRRMPNVGQGLEMRWYDGSLVTGERATPTPLLWHQLRDHALPVTGPDLDDRRVATDVAVLRDWCLDQVATTWTTWWDRAAVLLSAGGRESLGAAGPTSGVLGVVRLHQTLITGTLLSQCDSVRWALTVCEPEWTRLLQECLRVRHDPRAPALYRNPLQRRRDALDFVDLLLTADEEAFQRSVTPRGAATS